MTSYDANVNSNSTSSSPWIPQQRPNQLVFTKSVASTVVCSVYGGYPPPSVSLYVGPVDITGLFDEPTRLVQVTGVSGLRQVVYHTLVSTDRLVLGYSQSQLVFSCEATVPGLPAVSLHLTTLLQCKRCRFTYIHLLHNNDHLYLYNKRRFVCLSVCLSVCHDLCSVWPATRLGRSRRNLTHALMSTQGVFLVRSMSRSFMYACGTDRSTKHPVIRASSP